MRISLFVFICLSAFALPVTITVPFLSYYLVRYEEPYELVGLAFMVDLVHGTPSSAYLPTRFFVTIGASAAIIAVSLIKNYLRLHEYLPSKKRGW